jgi:hypothetical protein
MRLLWRQSRRDVSTHADAPLKQYKQQLWLCVAVTMTTTRMRGTCVRASVLARRRLASVDVSNETSLFCNLFVAMLAPPMQSCLSVQEQLEIGVSVVLKRVALANVRLRGSAALLRRSGRRRRAGETVDKYLRNTNVAQRRAQSNRIASPELSTAVMQLRVM